MQGQPNPAREPRIPGAAGLSWRLLTAAACAGQAQQLLELSKPLQALLLPRLRLADIQSLENACTATRAAVDAAPIDLLPRLAQAGLRYHASKCYDPQALFRLEHTRTFSTVRRRSTCQSQLGSQCVGS